MYFYICAQRVNVLNAILWHYCYVHYNAEAISAVVIDVVVIAVLLIVVDVVDFFCYRCCFFVVLFLAFSSLPAVAAVPCHRHWVYDSGDVDGTPDGAVLVRPEL